MCELCLMSARKVGLFGVLSCVIYITALFCCFFSLSGIPLVHFSFGFLGFLRKKNQMLLISLL